MIMMMIMMITKDSDDKDVIRLILTTLLSPDHETQMNPGLSAAWRSTHLSKLSV